MALLSSVLIVLGSKWCHQGTFHLATFTTSSRRLSSASTSSSNKGGASSGTIPSKDRKDSKDSSKDSTTTPATTSSSAAEAPTASSPRHVRRSSTFRLPIKISTDPSYSSNNSSKDNISATTSPSTSKTARPQSLSDRSAAAASAALASALSNPPPPPYSANPPSSSQTTSGPRRPHNYKPSLEDLPSPAAVPPKVSSRSRSRPSTPSGSSPERLASSPETDLKPILNDIPRANLVYSPLLDEDFSATAFSTNPKMSSSKAMSSQDASPYVATQSGPSAAAAAAAAAARSLTNPGGMPGLSGQPNGLVGNLLKGPVDANGKLKDAALMVGIKLDLEAEVHLTARVRGDILVGLY